MERKFEFGDYIDTPSSGKLVVLCPVPEQAAYIVAVESILNSYITTVIDESTLDKWLEEYEDALRKSF